MLKRFFNTRHFPIAFGLLITLLAGWFQTSNLGPIRSLQERVELLAYDFRFNFTLPDAPTPDNRIVIVDLDEKSLKEIGRWPWPRNQMATLTENLFGYGAIIIGYDQVFSEAELNTAQTVLHRLEEFDTLDPATRELLQRNTARFDHDGQFGEALSGGDTVLGFMFNSSGVESVRPLPPPPPYKLEVEPRLTAIKELESFITSIEPLQEHALSSGFLTATPDIDGIIRRTPLVLRHDNEIYPSLALEVARNFLLLDDYTIHVEQIGDSFAVESILLGKQRIATDEKGQVVIPFRGDAYSYRYISAADIIHQRLPENALQNSIILIGTTAQGLNDLVPTTVQSVYPGVEVHANIISAILDNHFPSVPAWADGANLMILLATGVLLAILLPFMGPVLLILTSILVAQLLIVLNGWLWDSHGIILNIATPLLLNLLLTVPNMSFSLLTESQRRKELKTMFGQYIPPQLVEQMSQQSGNDFGFEGESREMTVLFADIRSFTTLSESLTPGELKNLLNRYFTHMTQIIFDHNGTVDKYVGDMIMAFWGAPLEDPDHRKHAITAALEMLQRTADLEEEFRNDGLPEVRIGIGLNTGVMNVGDMGSTFRRAYTVLGDAVNLGSRLEGQTKNYGVGLIVGENTYQEQDEFVYRQLDLIQVKGKTEPVEIYQPVCRREEATKELLQELKQNEQAFALYLKGDFDQALQAYRQLVQAHPEVKTYSIYVERIEELQRNTPPTEWNGVYVLTSK